MTEKFLNSILDDTFKTFSQVVDNHELELTTREIGKIKSIGNNIAIVDGLSGVQLEELVRFSNDILGLAFNLDADEVGVILLNNGETLNAGDRLERTGRVFDVPVGEGIIGRVLTPTGLPLDNQGAIKFSERKPVEREAYGIMDRSPVTVPLQTGIKVIDALIPIGRGQRELILGDRQTGKTTIALDTIINQKDTGVICIYCAIGQRNAAVAKLIANLTERGCMDYTTVVVASGDDPSGLQYIAPYAATSMAEYFMEQGKDVLIVYDDLTNHAIASRELSLLLRRPPGREAYPGDIFYVHSRLLERSTHLRPELGGGSITALPVIQTEAQNLSAYIPTNLISITDGQIYLSPDLFQKGIFPAVEVGRSVSRVGGKTQLSAYRAVAGDLRLSYSQFQELEVFARFGTRLDEATRQTLERGKRVREIFKQNEFHPLKVEEQIAVLLGVIEGLFDQVQLTEMKAIQKKIQAKLTTELPTVCQEIRQGEKLSEKSRQLLVKMIQKIVKDRLDFLHQVREGYPT
jgi:F-type H+-transporting ATPase subunit alpha